MYANRSLTADVLLQALAIHGGEGEKHALLIGVQEYTDKELPKLHYAENDVRVLAEVLKTQGYAPGNIHLLTASHGYDSRRADFFPTKKNIDDWLNYINKNVQPQDTVLVAFAGHGIELKVKLENEAGEVILDDAGKPTWVFQPFLCPMGASLDDPKTLVSIPALYKSLDKNCRANVRLLVIDACRVARGARVTSVTRPLIPAPPGGIVAFYSCGKGQKAHESDVFKHGIFFHYFIEGLKGAAASKEGEVTVPLLEHYLMRHVPRTVVQEQKSAQAEQYPERLGQLLGEVVLAKFSVVQPQPEVLVQPSVASELQPAPSMTLDLGNNVKSELVKIPTGTFNMDNPPDAKPGECWAKFDVPAEYNFIDGKAVIVKASRKEWRKAETVTKPGERTKNGMDSWAMMTVPAEFKIVNGEEVMIGLSHTKWTRTVCGFPPPNEDLPNVLWGLFSEPATYRDLGDQKVMVAPPSYVWRKNEFAGSPMGSKYDSAAPPKNELKEIWQLAVIPAVYETAPDGKLKLLTPVHCGWVKTDCAMVGD